MLKSKYIIIFAVAMSLLGFVFQKQTHTPNQEIVVQFNYVQVSSAQVQSTISSLENQLKDLGAYNIKFIEGENGKLKIVYYSSLDVDSVKHLFLKNESLALNFNILNKQNKSDKSSSNKTYNSDYQFQIHEIQKDRVDTGLKGVLVVNLDTKSDSYFNNTTFFFSEIYHPKILDDTKKGAKIIYGSNAVILHDISKCNPEVRAGPIS